MGETKFAWLIESKTPEGEPIWWMASHEDEWTKDANKAVHFTDKRSAEMVRDFEKEDAIVTEHGFG